MYKINVYKTREDSADIFPLKVGREWMDETAGSHAYRCFPVSLTNQLGWGISFPDDIVFRWDGISDTSSEHIKVVSGEKHILTGRANATVGFNTGLMFETDNSVSMLQIPVPNLFIDGITPFTTIMSTSFFFGDIPVVWRVTRPNVDIIVKAGTPVISLIPIDLSMIQDSEINLYGVSNLPKQKYSPVEYMEKTLEISKKGKWSNFYRNAIDHNGNKLGSHQVRAIKLNVNNHIEK